MSSSAILWYCDCVAITTMAEVARRLQRTGCLPLSLPERMFEARVEAWAGVESDRVAGSATRSMFETIFDRLRYIA